MRIDHVQIMIPAGREHEAAGYYAGLLGMLPIPRPEGGANPGLWYRCGGQEVHLGVQEGPPDPASRGHVAFGVKDLDRMRGSVAGADFEVRDAPAIEGRRRFHTRDPFGNRLEFIEE